MVGIIRSESLPRGSLAHSLYLDSATSRLRQEFESEKSKYRGRASPIARTHRYFAKQAWELVRYANSNGVSVPDALAEFKQTAEVHYLDYAARDVEACRQSRLYSEGREAITEADDFIRDARVRLVPTTFLQMKQKFNDFFRILPFGMGLLRRACWD